MAEAVGLAASIATLAKCTEILLGLRDAFKHHSDKLDNLKNTLMGVQMSSQMIHLYIVLRGKENTVVEAEPPTQSHSSHGSNENMKYLIKTCSKNLASLVKRVKKDISRLDKAQKQRQGFWKKVYYRFNKAKSAVQLYLNEGRLEELILTTKNVETSLGVTLTGLLFCQFDIQSTQYDSFAADLRKQFNLQTEAFGSLKKSLDDDKSPVASWRKVEEISRTTQRTVTVSLLRGYDAASEDQDSKDVVDSSSLVEQTEDTEISQLPENVDEILTALNDNLDEDAQLHTPSVVDDESEICEWDFIDQSSTIIAFDSVEINIKAKSWIYKDVDIDLPTCFCSDSALWKFCTKSLLMVDTGETTFVLQNPCETSCEHISIQTESVTGFNDEGLSQALQVTLSNSSINTESSSTIQDQLCLSLTGTSSPYSNHLCTGVFRKEDGMNWVAERCELVVVPVSPNTEGEENDDENRTAGEEEQVKEGEEGESDDTSTSSGEERKLGPFSSMPCLFCRQDALNPTWSGSGHAGFLVGSNSSLRMTCERCKDSTWISAMTWGPSFPGGVWCVG